MIDQVPNPAVVSMLNLHDLHHSISPCGDQVPSKDKGETICDAQTFKQVFEPDETPYQPVFDHPFLCTYLTDRENVNDLEDHRLAKASKYIVNKEYLENKKVIEASLKALEQSLSMIKTAWNTSALKSVVVPVFHPLDDPGKSFYEVPSNFPSIQKGHPTNVPFGSKSHAILSKNASRLPGLVYKPWHKGEPSKNKIASRLPELAYKSWRKGEPSKNLCKLDPFQNGLKHFYSKVATIAYPTTHAFKYRVWEIGEQSTMLAKSTFLHHSIQWTRLAHTTKNHLDWFRYVYTILAFITA
jgi:hypothetical protein